MSILFISVYVGGYLILTDVLDVSLHATFNCTNSTRQTCHKCHAGSFANQSMNIFVYVHFFSACIVNIWNSLPNSVVDASTVNAFKAQLDTFW